MPQAVVLDTSVIVKWVRQEEVLAGEALAGRRRFLEGEISVIEPDLAAYELANVLRYKGDLTTEQVKEAAASLYEMGFEWFSLTPAVLLRAVEIARGFDVPVYDAAFLATAEAVDAAMVTADDRLVLRVASLTSVKMRSLARHQP